MPHQGKQDAPEQLVLIFNFSCQHTDHISQVKTPWRLSTFGAAIVPRRLEVALPQLSIFLQVEEKHVNRRPRELIDPLAGRCLEHDVHFTRADLAALVQETL